MDYESFRYVYSSSLKEKLQIKIGTLEGENQKPPDYKKLLDQSFLRYSGLYSESCPSFQVKLELFNKGKSICLPVTTSYKAFTKRWSWNEWIQFNLNFCDIPKTAVLALTIYDCTGPGKTAVIGGTSISLFGKNGLFRQGMFDLRIWLETEGDGNYPTKTPGKGKNSSKSQMQRLGKLAKKHRNGQIQKVDWLDRLTFREIEVINENEKKKSKNMYLMIEFPTIYINDQDYAVVYFEPEGDRNHKFISKPKIVSVPDSEIEQENLLERKHHCLARSARSGLSDRDAKPNAHDRDLLYAIVYRYPPTYNLTSEQQDLLWKYRFYLSSHKKALTKFLKCINWQTGPEVRQALNLLAQWEAMDVEDALELLSPTFTHPEVRKYAITRLQQAPDDDLLLYLLQLVQALKYENVQNIYDAYRNIMPEKEIIKSLDENFDQDPSTYSSSQSSEMKTTVEPKSTSLHILFDKNANAVHDLCTFLIQRACLNPTLANYFYWYLSIEVEDQDSLRKQDEKNKNMYRMVLKMFLKLLDSDHLNLRSIRYNLEKQQKFIDELVKLVKMIVKEPGNRNKKTEKFKQLLNDTEIFKINFSQFEPIPFPLNPDVYITKIVGDKTSLFKSALMPAKLTFITTIANHEYVAIFKHGDDLRQDELILQMITLMDKLLQRENLDLKLTPYKVLATSSKHGFVQYIDSYTVADVLAKDGSIHNFFRKHNPCENGPYGISAETMDTYVKSCAGYCVITYLLGVGDRHLDNLLLTQNGKLFHIDFGYILGRDPKPMPPPMKLSKEMVEAMGGISSEHYHEFRNQCFTAFLHLRRHANVLLNLFSLMVDASVPDIALEPDKAVKKVEENLQLELTDEEAVQHIQNLLDISITAVMPALVEQIHKIAQYWRK